MKKIVKILGLLFLLVAPINFSNATSGACSYHSGANCDIGAINNRAICNDGWLSSVLYSDMEECIGYFSSCNKHLYANEYNQEKTALKDKLNLLKNEIDNLKFELSSLDYKEQQAILEYYESIKGRGVSTGGAQPFINAIHSEYDLKRTNTTQSINEKTNQYNNFVKEYNSICRKYTDEEKNNICNTNFGTNFFYLNGYCIEQKVACTSWTYSDWSDCVNNIQIRTILSSFPKGCISGSPITTQACVNKITENTINKKIADNTNNDITSFVNDEKSKISKIDNNLTNKLRGKILLQVENNGQAWYVNPKDGLRYYMADGNEAYNIMKNLGIGIANTNLDKIKTNSALAKKYSGKIFLQVQSHGEAYYIDFNGVAHYLKDGNAAYNIMRNLGLGITNDNLKKINIKI